MRYWITGLLLWSIVAPGLSVWADCTTQKQQAVSILMNFKQRALLGNEPVSPTQFKAQFNPIVAQMKREGCTPELMELMNLIQSEQLQYPTP